MKNFWSLSKSKPVTSFWLLPLLAILLLPFSALSQEIVVESVLALVNEEPLYKSELEEFRRHLQQGIYSDDLVIPDDETRQKALKDPEFLLEKLIQSKVIDSEIKKMDIEVTSEQIDQEMRKIAGYNNLSLSEMTAELRRQGFDLQQYRNLLKNNLKRRMLIEREVTSKVKVSEGEVADFIERNYQGQYSSEIFNYDLSHILISTRSRSEQEALARVKMVQSRLAEGTSFEELAADFSEDPAFSPGGRLGQFHASELSPEFRTALNQLDTGQVSAPVRSGSGYHLLKILGKTVIPDPRVQALKQRAQEELYARNFQNQFEFWMRQRRSAASVRVNSP